MKFCSIGLSLVLLFFSTVFIGTKERLDLVKKNENLTDKHAGLVTVLNCQDSSLPIALAEGGCFLVHSITNDRSIANKIRKELGSSLKAGMINIEYLSMDRLLYNDRSVDLLVS